MWLCAFLKIGTATAQHEVSRLSHITLKGLKKQESEMVFEGLTRNLRAQNEHVDAWNGTKAQLELEEGRAGTLERMNCGCENR